MQCAEWVVEAETFRCQHEEGMEEKTDAGHGLRQICQQRKGTWRLGKDCDVGLGSFYEVTRAGHVLGLK